jgi:hypothetical protein
LIFSICTSPVIVDDCRILVTTLSGQCSILDLQTGAILLDVNLQAPIFSTPVIAGQLAIIVTGKCIIDKLNISTFNPEFRNFNLKDNSSTVNIQYPDASDYENVHFRLNRIWITGQPFDNRTSDIWTAELDHFIIIYNRKYFYDPFLFKTV